MDEPTIDCMFTCDLCGAKDVHFYVLARNDGQDVKQWMDATFTPALVEAHGRFSPGCIPKTMTDVKIPATNPKGIGYREIEG